MRNARFYLPASSLLRLFTSLLATHSSCRNPAGGATFSTYASSSTPRIFSHGRFIALHPSDLFRSRRNRAPAARSREERREIGARTSSNARETADGLTEAIASALFGWADRFRQGASSFGDQSTAFGKDAARYGSAALTRVTEETEQRPLLAIAVALGVGILIGMAARGRT
jgi:hypothetical protein